MADGYIFNILDLNTPKRNSHKFRNALECFHKRYPKHEGFITDGSGMWFAINDLYETTTHTDYYCQVTFHNLSVIKNFDKNPDNAAIGVVFNKFIAAICEHKHGGRMSEELYECARLTLISYIINPVANLHRNIKICEKVKNQGHGFTYHQMICALLEYSKGPVTIQYYANDQSHAKAAGAPL